MCRRTPRLSESRPGMRENLDLKGLKFRPGGLTARIRGFLLALAFVPILFSLVHPAAEPGLTWWTTHALEKIRPYDRPPADALRAIRIQAARNEFEPFQVVLRAEGGDVEKADIEVTDLQGPGGAMISKR